MITKIKFLKSNRPIIVKKTLERLNQISEIRISKKLVKSFINKIYNYLSSKTVYINVYDNNFVETIVDDVLEMIYAYKCGDYEFEFLKNFKTSIRQIPNAIRDRLMEFNEMINFEDLRSRLESLNKNSPLGGRPPKDCVLMFKILFLMEYFDENYAKIAERIKSDEVCQCFLGYPTDLPCKSTIWNFREKIVKKGIYKEIWDDFIRLINNKGYYEGNAVSQDASFLIADPGHKKASHPRGDEAKTRRSCDGTFMKKINKSYFGYKVHTKKSIENQLVFDFEVTTASLHDKNINLCRENQIDYKDKAYFLKNQPQINGRMNRSTRGHPITIFEIQRNNRISRKRCPVERTYSIIKRLNHQHTTLTTTKRNKVKVLIILMIENIEQLITLEKQKKQKNEVHEKEKENKQTDTHNFLIFSRNNDIYLMNFSHINFLFSKIDKKKLGIKKPKNNQNQLKISKSEYKREKKRKNKYIWKNKNKKQKKLEKDYQKLINSFNSFNIVSIQI
jgi:IS5 family transposase